jgi:hypothetical protein
VSEWLKDKVFSTDAHTVDDLKAAV